MSREIKFRAWDGSRMIYPSIIGISPLEDFAWEHSRGFIHNCQDWSEHEDFIYDPILMQYTGLKDKNGKEIYEGDIIQSPQSIQRVVFHEGCFCIQPVGKDSKPHHIYNLNLAYWEVIGNIHQNPELLNPSPSN